MRFISTKTHGILDYLMGIVLIIAPWIFGFAEGGAETWIFVVLGAGMIVYSLLTNYEYSALKAIPMTGHLWIDGLSGILLAASPWLFNFNEIVYLPHVIFGVLEVGAALMTKTEPEYQLREGEVR